VQDLPQVDMIQRIEEAPDVHLDDPGSPKINHTLPDGFERLVRRAPRAKAVRAGQEVLLVHNFQSHGHRALEHLVLQRWDPERTGFVAASFRDVHPSDGRCPVAARLGAVEE
jgi:hypothetical protein